MKKRLVSFLTLTFLTLSLVSTSNSWADGFPIGPDTSMTPGELCEHADSLRYDEKIPYCNRNVSPSEKWDIIDDYEAKGFEIRRYGRENFKIDHLIPLCAGGSNSSENLWPQHVTIYEQTDRIEEMTCRMMAQGLMLQSDAVGLILDTKLNLEKAPEVERTLSTKLDTESPWVPAGRRTQGRIATN